MSSAYGLSTDKDQSIEVEADTAELDDTNNVSVYAGDVIVTRGSIRMTGDKMTVHHTDEDELDYLIMQGKYATYRQLPNDGEVYDQAVALQMEYYEEKNLIILISDACVKQADSIITGQRIEYNTLLNQVKVYNEPKQELENATQPETKQRVKLVIRKNKEDTESDNAGASPEIPANLRDDCKIIPEKPPLATQ